MTGIASTTANLALWRMQWENLFSLPQLLDETRDEPDTECRLGEVMDFGENPGRLRMFSYVPPGLPSNAPLVVVLHGCTQTASSYDRGSGWSRMAERHGFAVVYAQQGGQNNPRRCFNWFRLTDIERDRGEAASIRAMIAHMVTLHGLDDERIFVTGLSAGGAMTNVMLAAYPEVFAAGAIIAGLPYRAATSVHDALQVMLEGVVRPAQERARHILAASPQGRAAMQDHHANDPVRWPRISVWQGLDDQTVKAVNATEIVKQWSPVLGVNEADARVDMLAGQQRLRWRDDAGQVVLESISIKLLGHGVPIDTMRPGHLEQPEPYFYDIGLSATEEIARFFGILSDDATRKPGRKADKTQRSVQETIASVTAKLPATIAAMAQKPAPERELPAPAPAATQVPDQPGMLALAEPPPASPLLANIPAAEPAASMAFAVADAMTPREEITPREEMTPRDAQEKAPHAPSATPEASATAPAPAPETEAPRPASLQTQAMRHARSLMRRIAKAFGWKR